MAFTRATLALASAHGNSDASMTFNYKTTDTIATVIAANYFDDATTPLHAGDIIIASCGDGFRISEVASVSAAGVVVLGEGVSSA